MTWVLCYDFAAIDTKMLNFIGQNIAPGVLDSVTGFLNNLGEARANEFQN